MAAQEAFPPPQPGVSEVKVLPAGVLLKSTGSGNYFSESNRLFGPLFRYISTRDIAMTTPVEAKIDQAAMYFWVAPSEEAKVTGNAGSVEVVRIPERRVASRGARGGYSQENYVRTRDELLAWMNRTRDPLRGPHWARRPWGSRPGSTWGGPTRPRPFDEAYYPKTLLYDTGKVIDRFEYSKH